MGTGFRWAGLAAAGIAISAWAGCDTQGSSGQECITGGSLLYPTYSCNAGLVCNTAESTPTCEQANAQAIGGPCGSDDNCVSGSFCDIKKCQALIAEGQPCPDGTGCAAGLTCLKVPVSGPLCLEPDGGGIPVQQTVTTDAAASDADGGDGSATDAALPDGDAASDAASG